MHKQHAKRKPDFFTVLVLLVLLCFGVTVMLQVMSTSLENETVSHPVNPPVKSLQARSYM